MLWSWWGEKTYLEYTGKNNVLEHVDDSGRASTLSLKKKIKQNKISDGSSIVTFYNLAERERERENNGREIKKNVFVFINATFSFWSNPYTIRISLQTNRIREKEKKEGTVQNTHPLSGQM